MLEITPGSRDRLSGMGAFAMDMDGTIYLGDRLLPGAVQWLTAVRDRQSPLVFLTNNSSRSQADYVYKLNDLGLAITAENVMTSGEATLQYLLDLHDGASVLLVGTPSLTREFKEAGVRLTDSPEKADLVVLGFDTTITYARLRALCDCVRRDLPFVATHPDFNCPTENGYMPDVGSFLALVEASTGRRPDAVIGKPSRWMTKALSRRLGLAPRDIAYVGDRLYTDVAMARDSGMLAVLTLTGETALDDLAGSEVQPDLVVDDLLELRGLL
ncbi:MAG: HAD-IIA family hydrolase [Deltaproteobacteria bacterium]|nr:HAD-IIA family hydrolase [Deltaproteobacteria bacterium]